MFRFSIRNLLWLTVVVAVIAGAWLERGHLAGANARLQKQLEEYDHLITKLATEISRKNVPFGSPNKERATNP